MGGVRMSVNDAIEDICRQKLQLSSVHVNTSHLQQAVMAFGEDIRTPRFEYGSSTRKHFIDIRGMLLKAGVSEDYTYEPYLSSGHICLTELVYPAYLAEIFADYPIINQCGS